MKEDLEIKSQNGNLLNSNLDISLPILERDIPDFKQWINWSGWKGYSPFHTAYDFAAYLDNKGECVLGLEENTPIRAVADGYISKIRNWINIICPYYNVLSIKFLEDDNYSAHYLHIKPSVKKGQMVKRGDVIGKLYKDEENNQGRLVHLHFELVDSKKREIPIEDIYPSLKYPRAVPQGDKRFKLLGFEKQPKIKIANFRRLLVQTKNNLLF